ncbi:hypothetical protein, partial [Escherichia coli]|uniref:hypothetical protein n=1 Tax=Escherichia coli TaxID=562 RepID=UPI0012FFAE20
INTEKLKADDTAYIESRRKRFSIIWNSFNAVIAIVVLGLFCLDNNMSPSNKLEEEVKAQPQPQTQKQKKQHQHKNKNKVKYKILNK